MSASDPILENHPVDRPLPFCSRSTVVEGAYETPSTCHESKDPTSTGDMDLAVLFAEGVAKIIDLVYPMEINELTEVFISYDEPLQPMPAGTSVFYFIMIAWILTFYFTYLGRKILSGVKKKLDLNPEANKFPHIPLYWLQQSKREAGLRREVRNTWAWLAKSYLLSPNDPLLANVDQVLGLINWHDFEVTRNTWSLVKCILRLNALFVRVRRHKNDKKRKSFKILRDVDLQQVPTSGDVVPRIFEEWDEAGYHTVSKGKRIKSMVWSSTSKTNQDGKNLLKQTKSKQALLKMKKGNRGGAY